MIYLAALEEKIEHKIKGYEFIDTMDTLNKIVAQNTQSNKIIICSDFAHEFFTPMSLNTFLADVKQINRNLIIELDDDSNVMTEDKFMQKLRYARDVEDLLTLASFYPKEFVDTIHSLVQGFYSTQEEILSTSVKVSQLQGIIDDYRKQNDDLAYTLKLEQVNKVNLSARFNSLIGRIKNQYSVNIDKSKLFVVNDNAFDKILYIKEITRVQYIDSLLYYLKEIFKVLYSMPTRLVAIESFYATGKTSLYKDLVPHYRLLANDVLKSDILMLGVQPNLMGDILSNPMNTSILIVLDRAGYATPHIKGSNVEYFYTVSDLNDAPENIPQSRIISYDESTLYVPYINNFNELDANGKMTAYSSTSIVKRLVNLMEGR